MTGKFRRQIYNELNLRETDDLLEIWKENDRVEWSNETFEVIEEILKNRRVEIPQQDEPIREYNDEKDEVENYDFSDEELKIIEDENPPEFYKPFEVIKLGRWIDLAARVMVVLAIIHSLFGFSSSQRIVQAFFIMHADSPWILPITVLLVVVNVATDILITYFPLVALSKILRLLMEMEFNSRKTQTNPFGSANK
jgi:hypothetical protein